MVRNQVLRSPLWTSFSSHEPKTALQQEYPLRIRAQTASFHSHSHPTFSTSLSSYAPLFCALMILIFLAVKGPSPSIIDQISQHLLLLSADCSRKCHVCSVPFRSCTNLLTPDYRLISQQGSPNPLVWGPVGRRQPVRTVPSGQHPAAHPQPTPVTALVTLWSMFTDWSPCTHWVICPFLPVPDLVPPHPDCMSTMKRWHFSGHTPRCLCSSRLLFPSLARNVHNLKLLSQLICRTWAQRHWGSPNI